MRWWTPYPRYSPIYEVFKSPAVKFPASWPFVVHSSLAFHHLAPPPSRRSHFAVGSLTFLA